MKKILSLLLLWSLCMICSVEASSLVQQLADRGVSIVYDKRVDTTLDSWIMFQENYSTKLSYWLERLPYNEDKYAPAYVVIPALWVVSPILYNTGMTNKEYTSDAYLSLLTSWVVQFPNGIDNMHNIGNMVIFWHSSYRNNDPGRYKNIFMTLPLLIKNQQIWLYQKDKNNVYKRTVYIITTSYETTNDDVSILSESDVRKITLFTCTPIGTSKKRRVVVWLEKNATTKKQITPLKKIIQNVSPDSQSWWHVVDISQITQKIADDALQKLIAKSYDPIDYSLWTIIESWNQAGLWYAWFARWQCTDYIASRRPDIFPNSRKNRPFWWHAKDRLFNAHKAWYKIGTVPLQWSIAVFAPWKWWHKEYGHVAIVEKVWENNLIEISDMNFSKKNVVTRRIISADLPAGYIY